MIQFLLQRLQLDNSRIKSIEAFSETIRLKPYVKIIEENPNIKSDLQKIYPMRIKDNWDCIVELYRYNIKLSKAIYPYLAILENIIKIRIASYLKDKYGENFYYNDKLFFEKLNFDDFDTKIFYEYFNHKINKFVREELIEKYQKHNQSLSKEKIKFKISQIKRAISVLSDAQEYRFKNANSNFMSFVETKTTLNYWITLLEIKSLYYKDNKLDCLELNKIFPNVQNNNIKTLIIIAQKLNDIRLLRNGISHYNRIICTHISKNLTLIDIYKNITELFYLTGCDDINYIVGDINCCKDGSFEQIYNKLSFIHSKYII